MRRLASKSTWSAEALSARLRRTASTAHHRHELPHVHLARVHALRHHLHHLIHIRHPRRRGPRHAGHSSSTAGIAAHAEHGFHLHVLVTLLCDRACHALLAHAVLRPSILVETVVEKVRLVGAGQAPELRVVGEVGVDVEERDGLVDAGPVGVGGEVDGAGADLGEVFAFFAGVGGGASEGRCCC